MPNDALNQMLLGLLPGLARGGINMGLAAANQPQGQSMIGAPFMSPLTGSGGGVQDFNAPKPVPIPGADPRTSYLLGGMNSPRLTGWDRFLLRSGIGELSPGQVRMAQTLGIGGGGPLHLNLAGTDFQLPGIMSGISRFLSNAAPFFLPEVPGMLSSVAEYFMNRPRS